MHPVRVVAVALGHPVAERCPGQLADAIIGYAAQKRASGNEPAFVVAAEVDHSTRRIGHLTSANSSSDSKLLWLSLHESSLATQSAHQ